MLWLWHCYHELRGFSGLGERASEGVGEGVRKRRRRKWKRYDFWQIYPFWGFGFISRQYCELILLFGTTSFGWHRRIKLKLMMLTPALHAFGSQISLRRPGDFVRGSLKSHREGKWPRSGNQAPCPCTSKDNKL